MNDDTEYEHPIILFDGVCNLCASSVQFIIKNDPKQHFRFASQQSDIGKDLFTKYNINSAKTNSLILIDQGKIYQKSTGALKIAKQLSNGWSFLYFFIIVPTFLRNPIYDFIAANRYKWFGKKEACWIPTPALKNLFLDSN
jgi:predicted DCC family thiol-disulfide oxidoreductase YuxK